MRRWLRRICIGTASILALVLAVGAYGWFAQPALVVVPLRQVGYWGMGITTTSVEVDGHEWPYLACGQSGAPAVVMLHGYGTSKDAMMQMMPKVAQLGYFVVAPDLPGFGDHPFHEGCVHDSHFYVQQLCRFMDAVNAPRAVLVGTSMGGALAAEMAIDCPERVQALALLSPAGVQPPTRNDFMRAVDRGELPLDIANEADFDRVVKLAFAHPPSVPRPLRAWLVERSLTHRANSLEIIQAMRPCLSCGLQGRLSQIKVPTLVLYGDKDAVTDPSMAQVFTQEMPAATVVTIPDAGHVAFYDNWPDVWRAMSALLAR